MRRRWFCLCLGIMVAAAVAAARGERDGRPVEPFRIVGTVHYVGTTELGSYLVSTGAGHIVIDGGYESTAPAILASIRRLGFDPEGRAGAAHDAGALRSRWQPRGARCRERRADHGDARRRRGGGAGRTPRRALRDKYYVPARARGPRARGFGSTVALGGVTLTAHLTPGHTPGCTTGRSTPRSRAARITSRSPAA